MRRLGSALSLTDLAANATLFACLPKHALRKIEPFLSFEQILLEVLYITLKGFYPRGDVARQLFRTSCTQTSNFEDHASNDPDCCQKSERVDDVSRVQVSPHLAHN